MHVTRLPGPSLRPFVERLWASDGTGVPARPTTRRELVLPTGGTHLAIRVAGEAFRVYAGLDDPQGRAMGHAVVGGARASAYCRDAGSTARSVGAQLRVGATTGLFGVPAHELAGRHTALDELWRDVPEVRDRLADAGTLDALLDRFEAALAAHVAAVDTLPPAVSYALGRLAAGAPVGRVVCEIGRSHRWFIEHFRSTVGLAPKMHGRLARFGRAVHLLHAGRGRAFVDVAATAGYADQPHFVREFVEMTGLTPGEYQRLAPARAHHVPIGATGRHQATVNFLQDRGEPDGLRSRSSDFPRSHDDDDPRGVRLPARRQRRRGH